MNSFTARCLSHAIPILLGALALFPLRGLSCSFGPNAQAASVYSYSSIQQARAMNMDWISVKLDGVRSPKQFEETLQRLKRNSQVLPGSIHSNYEYKAVSFILKKREPKAMEKIFR